MSTPYDRTFADLAQDMAEDAVAIFELRYPARGTLSRWAIKKTAGDMSAATVELYPDAVSAAAADVTRRICAKTATFPWAEALEIPYMNREGTPSNPVRKLYLRVTPSDGADDQEYTFELAMVHPQV